MMSAKSKDPYESEDLFDSDTDIVDLTVEKTTKPKVERICPYCDKKQQSLPRHLQRIHFIDNSDAKKISHKQRKRKPGVTLHRKPCPFIECKGSPPYPRLDNHLKTKHKLKVTDQMYRNICKVKRGKQVVSATDESCDKQEVSATDELSNKQEASATDELCDKQEVSATDGLSDKQEASDNKKLAHCRKSRLYSDFSRKQFFKFREYLQSIDGGMKGRVNATSQAYKIRQILNAAKIKNLEELKHEITGDRLSQYFTKLAKCNNANSIITYISVFLSFLQYLIVKTKVNKEPLDILCKRASNWRKAFQKVKVPSSKFKDIPAKDIRTCVKSSFVKSIIVLIFSLKKNPDILSLSKEKQADVRNVILFLILIRNSQRSCAIYNMTLQEFGNAKQYSERHIIQVKDHKTKAEHGPAEIVLTNKLYSLLQIYINRVRSMINKENNSASNFVFITGTGSNLSSSDFNYGINTVWKKAGFTSKFGSTNLRHITTTRVHEGHIEKAQEVADQLCHRKSTASNFYREKRKGVQSIKNSNFIMEINAGAEGDDHLENIYNECEMLSDMDNSFASNRIENSHTDKNIVMIPDVTCGQSQSESENNVDNIEIFSLSTDCDYKPSAIKYDTVINFDVESGRKGRVTFSLLEREIIEQAFSSYIEDDIQPKLATIRNIVKENKSLNYIVTENGYKETQIKGCLINLMNKRK